MNKTVFEAVKAWVKGIIGKVERRIKAVEKDVQTINRKLPNFLTPNYTTDKDINLIRQHVVSRLVHLEWKLDAELDYSRGADFYCNGFLDWGFDNSQVLFYKTNAAGETEGSYSYAFSYHEEDRPVVVFSSNAWESEGYSYPAGWSGLDFNTDTMQPLTEPPTLFLVEWDDPAFVDEVLPQIATLVEEKYEDYVASETYLHADGSDIRLEYSKMILFIAGSRSGLLVCKYTTTTKRWHDLVIMAILLHGLTTRNLLTMRRTSGMWTES